jgi:hypothetical protein
MTDTETISETTSEKNTQETPTTKETEVVETNPVVEPVEKSLLAEQFNRIAQQEKFIKSERQKIDEARKQFEAEKALADNYKAIKDKNPFEILEHFGITYEKLLEADKERNNPIDPTVKKALERVEQLELRLSKADKEAEEARIARAEVQLKADISKIVKEKEYDIIEKLGAEDTVKDYMEEYFNQTGEIPNIEDACQAIVDELANKFLAIKDSKWLTPKIPTISEEKTETFPDKVISNKLTQTSQPFTGAKTNEERMAEALTLLNSL